MNVEDKIGCLVDGKKHRQCVCTVNPVPQIHTTVGFVFQDVPRLHPSYDTAKVEQTGESLRSFGRNGRCLKTSVHSRLHFINDYPLLHSRKIHDKQHLNALHA